MSEQAAAQQVRQPAKPAAPSQARGVLQRACACGKHAGNGGECAECRKKRLGLQRRAVGSGPDVAPPIVHEVLRSPGRPLDDATRGFMESRFNHDFSGVRVHTDGRAAESARAVNALAYTVGQDVVFGAGQNARMTNRGTPLLAHELTHVIQQSRGQSPAPGDLRIAASSDPAEQEARRITQHFGVTGHSPHGGRFDAITSAPLTVARGEKWDAFWGAGPIDSYRADKLADEAKAAARATGLPGIHNGPADAWRHCYWSCRMTQVIGEEDAADIGEIHEKHGANPTAERMMDTWNNEEGRKCSGDCDTACQTKLDTGKLWVLSGGKVTQSTRTTPPRKSGGAKIDKY